VKFGVVVPLVGMELVSDLTVVEFEAAFVAVLERVVERIETVEHSNPSHLETILEDPYQILVVDASLVVWAPIGGTNRYSWVQLGSANLTAVIVAFVSLHVQRIHIPG
jgi:hypothetical protein